MIERLDVALLPAEAAVSATEAFVVVDILRATTTIAAFLAAGADRVVAVSAIEAARREATARRGVLAGEVGGLPPLGFDLGNSPVDASTAPVRGRDVVMFTTNGTKALAGCTGPGRVVYAGCLANAPAVALWLNARHRNVMIVCAGDEGGNRFGQDDFVAAGAIVVGIIALAPAVELSDAARLAADLWRGRGAAAIRESSHAAALVRLGLGADVAFAVEEGRWPFVPLVVESGPGWVVLEAATP